MPHHQLEQLEGGKVRVKLETGETFEGDPLEVTAKLADAKVETRRHYETQLEEEKKKNVPPVVTPPSNQDAKQLQDFVLTQHALALGYKDADEYKRDLAAVKDVTKEYRDQAISGYFLNVCKDFPNTEESINKLSERITKLGWDFSPQSMIAAHQICVQGNDYKALTADEQNAQWTQNLQRSNRVPPIVPGSGVDSRQPTENEWSIPLDKLRQQVLTGQR